MNFVKNLLRKLPLRGKSASSGDLVTKRLDPVLRLQQELYLQQLRREPRYGDPRHLIHFEHQVFSQNGEDGILLEIFRRIGVSARSFVELGTGSGLQCNTTFWLSQGWHGWWVEGNPKAPRRIGRQFAQPLAEKRLRLISSWITAENVAGLLQSNEVPAEVDLLSLDLDRNTYWIWSALEPIRPRVLVVEYNASYPASVDWKVPYDPAKGWNRTFHFGASLKALELLGRRLGYALVGCESTGINCFFVRNDLRADHFAGPFTAEHHYEPARYFLTRLHGHPKGFAD